MAFLTTQANVYTVMAALEDYLRGGDYDTNNFRDFFKVIEAAKSFRDRIDRTEGFERLSTWDCVQAYSTQYVSSRGDLLLVQNRLGADYYRDGTRNYSIVDPLDSTSYAIPSPSSQSYARYTERTGLPYVSLPITNPSYEWMCTWDSEISCNAKPDPVVWKPYGDIVQYCWSEKAKENCEVRFSLYFAITVIICNSSRLLACL